jgi:hypothetical protein
MEEEEIGDFVTRQKSRRGFMTSKKSRGELRFQ